ncbi:MAG: IS21 family transposase [Gammaproteobacteria bacterium]
MRKIRDVLRLHLGEHRAFREIQRSLGISRDAARDYVTRARAAGLSWPLPADLNDFELEARLFPRARRKDGAQKPEPDWAAIHDALKLKGATLQVLHQEYLTVHPGGLAYSFFCQRYREFRKSLKRYLRMTYVAGERVFVDYAGPTVPILNPKTGVTREAQIFVGVLGASIYTYCEAHWHQSLEHWIGAHQRMYAFFDGVPQLTICDNLKAAVTRASRTEPELNTSYQDMAAHYGTVVIPARPYSPTDKTRAEGGVLLVERWILFRLRKRIFTSLAELNMAIRGLLEELNHRPFQKLPGSRRETYERLDRPALKALPEKPYAFAVFKQVRVGFDYHVEFEGHYYSVPHPLRRQEVTLRATEHVMEVLHGGRRVATHIRNAEKGQKTTEPAHMDPSHRFFAKWNADQELDWALSIGPGTHAFLQVLLANVRHREQGYRLGLGMKKLQREFGDQRLEAACARALEIGATGVRNVRSILQAHLDQAGTDASTPQEATFDHGNIRGPDYYH